MSFPFLNQFSYFRLAASGEIFTWARKLLEPSERNQILEIASCSFQSPLAFFPDSLTPITVPVQTFVLVASHPCWLVRATATVPQLTLVSQPLGNHSVCQARVNQHAFFICVSLCCSETCYAALFISAQSYQTSEFLIPPEPDASDGRPLLHPLPIKQLRHSTYWNLPSSLYSPFKVERTLTLSAHITALPSGAPAPAPGPQKTSILYPPPLPPHRTCSLHIP